MDDHKKIQLLEVIWAPWRMSYIAPSAGELLTYEKLTELGIDSVTIY